MTATEDNQAFKDLVESLEQLQHDKKEMTDQECMWWIAASVDTCAQKIKHIEFRTSAVVDQEAHMERMRRLNAVMYKAAMLEGKLILKLAVRLMDFWWESKMENDGEYNAAVKKLKIEDAHAVKKCIFELMISAFMAKTLEKHVMNAEKMAEIEKQNVHLCAKEGHDAFITL